VHHHREIAYALLRVTVGMMFLFFGVGKLLGGVGGFASGMTEGFADTFLPSPLVGLFVYVLPFAEVAIGALLVLGLFNVATLTLTGLLVLALTFGKVVQFDPPTVAHNITLALVIFVLLWATEHNGYSLDRLRPSKPLMKD
jgi:thiosulfate dehydrogenase [quinone] large subunit